MHVGESDPFREIRRLLCQGKSQDVVRLLRPGEPTDWEQTAVDVASMSTFRQWPTLTDRAWRNAAASLAAASARSGSLPAAGTAEHPDLPGRGPGDALISWLLSRVPDQATTVRKTLLRHAISLMPDCIPWQFELIGVCFDDNAPEELLSTWDTYSQVPESAGWHLAACRIKLRVSPAEAAEHAAAATALAAGNWIAHAAHAYCCAPFALHRGLRLKFQDFMSRPHRNRSFRNYRFEFETAIDSMRRAVELMPTAENWNDLGHILALADDLEGATEAFGTSLSINPSQRHAMSNFPVSLALQNRIEEARSFLAGRRFPTDLPAGLLRLADAAISPDRAAIPIRPQPLALTLDERQLYTVFSQAWWRALPASGLLGVEPAAL